MGPMMTRREALAGATTIALMASVPGTPVAEAAPRQQSEEVPMGAQDESYEPLSPWQGEPSFPDWTGSTSATLPINCTYSYLGYHGQGTIQVEVSEGVEDFRLSVNGRCVDTSRCTAGGTYDLDVSTLSIDGTNTLSVMNILPFDIPHAVTVRIPYPIVLPGKAVEEGINPQTLDMVAELIARDVEHGFPSAQLAIVRNGRLVYEGAWGRTNSYLPDGRPNATSPKVTTDTLYDLASNSKMYSVNYAIQHLVCEGRLDLDSPITAFLGEGFATQTILAHDKNGKLPEADLKTIKSWKAELTVRDLLRHQGGFPPSPKYPMQYLYKEDLAEGEDYQPNDLFAGNGADAATRRRTIQMINKTPLDYEPGTKTVYSDADYMILGLVVEHVTGKGLDAYLKETFFDPMGLTHITYNPLKAGFSAADCAATELNGNSRDHFLTYEGFRDKTIQGEVHDEMAYYSMAGVSGHAGLFANACDLAKLASVMLTGGYGTHRFFSKDMIDAFCAPKSEGDPAWGLGWFRQADQERPWYFGTQSSRDTIGHQGWTGTLTMVDPARNLVVVYLTNKINSPVTDASKDPNRFDGNWYTAATLGFVPEIVSFGIDEDRDVSAQLLDLSADMAVSSLRLIPDDVDPASDHPSVRNFESKRALFEHMAEQSSDTERVAYLRASIEAAYACVLEARV